MSHWWRAYDDAIDNPKLLKLSDALHRAWFTLQCIASANEGVLPPADDIATRLRIKPAKVAEWITRLVQAKLIDNVDGVFRPHNWDGRQFISDSSTPRVKRFRDKRRNVSSNVTSTLHETAPEAEAKADTETEQSRADASAPVEKDLGKREAGLRAGIGAHFAARGQTMPSNVDRVAVWLAQGFATGTVLAAVEKVLNRGKPVSTLEYFDGAIKDAHAKAAPENLQVVSSKVFVVHGTHEWNAWQVVYAPRGTPTRERKDAEGRVQVGWDFPTLWPEGFDEATGEKLPPSAEDAA